MTRYSGIGMRVTGALGLAALGCYDGTGTGPYDTDLSRLRAATVDFVDVTTAAAAGFQQRLTGCMVDPALGGMGYHIGNPGRINGTVELERPEVLLYEPRANDIPALVAVEYIVPFEAAAEPPVLMGRTFARNEAFGVWALHVWLYKDNPAGIFADWNPRVSCAAAPPEAAGAAPMQGGHPMAP